MSARRGTGAGREAAAAANDAAAGGGAAPGDSIVERWDDARGLARPPLLVRDALAAYLDARSIGSGALQAEPIGEGHSNVTFLIRRGDGTEVVLRRPPRPPLPPSAHDVLREARLLSAVQGRIRTPRVLATCADERVIGAPFYVMEKREGAVITSEIPPALDDPPGRRGIAEQLIEALVEIHAVDWRACGLEGYGKPTGYLARQLRRFGGLWEHNKTRELPALDRVTAWLGEHVPESPTATIVHGDYRLGNAMVASEPPPRIVAVFDWELATIGDPLADVGYLTATYPEPGDTAGTMFSLAAVTTRAGFPSRAELIDLYEQSAGRSMSDIAWYQTLALWKSAIFLEGSYKRLLAGTTDDPFFAQLDRGVPELAERAWVVAHGG